MKTLHTIFSVFAKHNMAQFLTILTILFTIGVGSMWGALSSPYECVFKTTSSLINKQVTTGDVTWTLTTTTGKGSPTTTFGNTNGQSAIKLGSGKSNYYSKMTLTTSAFSSYNVTKVVLYISSNNGGSKTITVKQGDIQIGTGSQFFNSTTWVTNCTRNTNKGAGGDLSIEINSDATATFIHSITITYETAVTTYTVTYNANGGSGTMSKSTGTSITIANCSFVAPQCKKFSSWNTAANGSGTKYTPNATVSANLTLYAQWEDIPSYTVKLMDNNEVLTSSCNTPITLPNRKGCDGYQFVGWTKTWIKQQDEWTDVAPDDIPAGDYTPTGNEELYPVYSKVEDGGSEPTAYSAGDVGSFIIASNVGNKWYAIPENPTLSSSKITGVEITVSQTDGGVKYVSTANAEGYTWTIADATNGQTISDGTKYIYHSNGGSSGTDLAYGTSTSYTWKIEKENNGLTFKGMNGSTTNSRGLLFKESVFGGYALSNEDASGYYRIQVLPIGGGSTTYYISVPNCCTPLATVNGKVQISNISETSATASWSWSSATTGISKNILKVYESNGALVKTIDGITPSATSQNITDLTTCTEYYATLTTVRSNESYCEGIEQGKSVNFTTKAWNVTASLTNTSRLTGTDVACSSSDYVATFEAAADYALPETIIVEIGDEEKTAGSDYNWDKATGTLTIDASVIHGDINIFIVAECIVTFNMNGHGVVPAPQIIEENGTVTEPSPAPKAEGYDFGGWFTDSECTSPYDFSSPVTASFTLYAKWTAIEYTITYGNLNEVNNDANPKTYTIESETITLKNLDDTNTHHFVGWYDEDDYLVTKISQGSTGDITLYAKWVEIFSVKWYANGKELTNGELGSASTIVYEGEHISNLPPSGNLNNYCGDFVGWTDAEMDVNNVAKPNNLYTQASEFPNATDNQKFFAVFAE